MISFIDFFTLRHSAFSSQISVSEVGTFRDYSVWETSIMCHQQPVLLKIRTMKIRPNLFIMLAGDGWPGRF